MAKAGSRSDPRPYIYLALDLIAVLVFVYAIERLVPTWMKSAKIHMWSIPVGFEVLGLGTATIFVRSWRRIGRWIAIAGGSLLLLSTCLIIARLVASAAFLAGTYGAFGKAAASGAWVAVALIVEAVALLPLVQVKYLMSRAGRRSYSPGQAAVAGQAAT